MNYYKTNICLTKKYILEANHFKKSILLLFDSCIQIYIIYINYNTYTFLIFIIFTLLFYFDLSSKKIISQIKHSLIISIYISVYVLYHNNDLIIFLSCIKYLILYYNYDNLNVFIINLVLIYILHIVIISLTPHTLSFNDILKQESLILFLFTILSVLYYVILNLRNIYISHFFNRNNIISIVGTTVYKEKNHIKMVDMINEEGLKTIINIRNKINNLLDTKKNDDYFRYKLAKNIDHFAKYSAYINEQCTISYKTISEFNLQVIIEYILHDIKTKCKIHVLNLCKNETLHNNIILYNKLLTNSIKYYIKNVITSNDLLILLKPTIIIHRNLYGSIDKYIQAISWNITDYRFEKLINVKKYYDYEYNKNHNQNNRDKVFINELNCIVNFHDYNVEYVIPCDGRKINFLKTTDTPELMSYSNDFVINQFFKRSLEIEQIFLKSLSLTFKNISIFEKAICFIKRYHWAHIRQSKEPYYVHLIYVAQIVNTMTFNQDTIIAALLHDILENSFVNEHQISLLFGEHVTSMLKSLTVFKDIEKNMMNNFSSFYIKQILDTFDREVIIIKLADRLHNIISLHYKSSDKCRLIINETTMFFIPIARALGYNKIADEMAFFCKL